MRVSVIVTSFNYENYIRQTLESIATQTYKNFEVIIVDDGSKDNSLNIIKEFTKKYPNFHLYTHENNQNKGLVESLKLGISKVQTEYIAFLESDDYWSTNYLQEKIDYIKKHPETVILINDIQTFGSDVADIGIVEMRKIHTKEEYKKRGYYNFIASNVIATFSIVFIKTDILKDLNFDTPIAPWLDWWLFSQVAVQYPIEFIDKKLTFWNRHDGSYITKRTDKNAEKIFHKKRNLFLLKKYPKLYYKYFLLILFKNFLKFIFSIKNSSDRQRKIITILGWEFLIKKSN